MAKGNWEIYYDAVKKPDWPLARKVLGEIAKTEKNNPQVYLKLGDVCRREGDTASAVKVYHVSARIQHLQGFTQKAIALYKIILRLDPQNAEALSRTETLINELGESRGQHFQAAHSEDAGQIMPQASSSMPPDPPVTAPGFDIAESATGVPDRKVHEESIHQEQSPENISGAPSWLETTRYEDGDQKSCGSCLSQGTVPEGSHDLTGEVGVVDNTPAVEEGIPSIEKIFSDLRDDEFQKLLDDLVIPDSVQIAGTSNIPDIFAGMSEEDYERTLSALGTKKYDKGYFVIEEGDSGDSMYIIKSGRARVVAHMLRREIELATLSDGDLFGEVAFLSGRPRTASVISDGPLEVYEIGRPDIEMLIAKRPEILSRIEGFYESRAKDTVKKVMMKRA